MPVSEPDKGAGTSLVPVMDGRVRAPVFTAAAERTMKTMETILTGRMRRENRNELEG